MKPETKLLIGGIVFGWGIGNVVTNWAIGYKVAHPEPCTIESVVVGLGQERPVRGDTTP